ncbi:hypothetical protein [Borreliella valaisiana]
MGYFNLVLKEFIWA